MSSRFLIPHTAPPSPLAFSPLTYDRNRLVCIDAPHTYYNLKPDLLLCAAQLLTLLHNLEVLVSMSLANLFSQPCLRSFYLLQRVPSYFVRLRSINQTLLKPQSDMEDPSAERLPSIT